MKLLRALCMILTTTGFAAEAAELELVPMNASEMTAEDFMKKATQEFNKKRFYSGLFWLTYAENVKGIDVVKEEMSKLDQKELEDLSEYLPDATDEGVPEMSLLLGRIIELFGDLNYQEINICYPLALYLYNDAKINSVIDAEIYQKKLRDKMLDVDPRWLDEDI